jgi:hypothetical protein
MPPKSRAGTGSLTLVRDVVYTVGQRRRGERVTGLPGESTAVEGEFVPDAAVGATTRRGAVRRGHEITGFGWPVRYTPWNR